MNYSVAIVEVIGSANAVYILDVMLKASGVSLISWETIFGIGRVTVFVRGNVSDVKAAVEAAKKDNTCKIFASYVIANPQKETRKMLENSARNHGILFTHST